MALDQSPVTATDMGDDGEPEKKTPQQIADYYLDAIQSAEKRRKPFIARGKQIVKRYKNKRTLTTLGVPIANRRMNVLWSNVQTQKPVLFAQPPKANVSRRNKSKDAIGRTAAITLQNCLQNSLGMEDFSYVMGQVVEDRLLPGAGIAMVEYVPEVKENEVGWQAAETRYINWQDWVTNPARTWQEVWLFGYRVYLTRRECYDIALKNGGQELADDVYKEITLDHREDGKEKSNTSINDIGPAKATVWCIWDMNAKEVIQISPGYAKAPLAVMPPPVNFDKFFPIPRPLQSTTSNDSTNPVPDFEQYVDQADEIDLLTQRIGVLSQALRLRGLYPADMDSLKQLTEAGDADMIPYDQWQILMERGGAEALVIWFPIEAIAKTLQYCLEARDKAIDIMYQVTGISDIQRGDTDPDETKGAQQLKAQFGGLRIRDSQKDVQRFIRDLLRLKAEIICEHFTLEVIQKMSGMRLLTDQQKQQVQQALQIWAQFGQAMQQFQQQAQQPPQQASVQPGAPGWGAPSAPQPPVPPRIPQPPEEMIEALKEPSWEQVMAVLRDEKLRGFVVDVETDSTVEPDQQAQQQAASQFVESVTQFMLAAAQVVMADPEAAPMMGEMLSWAANQWKGADTIVGAVDEYVEQIKKKVEQMRQNPPPPNPKVQAEQTKLETAQVKGQAEGQKAQAGVVAVQMQAKADQEQLALQAQVDQMNAAMEAQSKRFDMAIEQMRAQMEADKLARQAALDEQQHQRELERIKEERKAANANGAEA